MFVLAKGISKRSRRKELIAARIKSSLSVGIKVNRGREKQVYVLGYTPRHHHLQVIGEIASEVFVTLDARISRESDRRISLLVKPVITGADFNRAAQSALAQRRTRHTQVEPIGNAIEHSQAETQKTIETELVLHFIQQLVVAQSGA